MLGFIQSWLRHRWQKRQCILHDAKQLIAWNEQRSYYEAQRRAVRARCEGNRVEFVHWTMTAQQIALQSAIAEMDYDVLTVIADTEQRKFQEEIHDPAKQEKTKSN